MPIQRTLRLDDGSIVYCYDDGTVEFHVWKHGCLYHYKTKGHTNRGCGYMYVMINKKSYAVHRLIAYAFLPNIDNKPEVDHINRIKTDNKVSNLRWVTREENLSNRYDAERSKAKYGVRSCEDLRAYQAAHRKFVLSMRKPDGTQTATGHLLPEEMDILKPLSRFERYPAYLDLLSKRNQKGVEVA